MIAIVKVSCNKEDSHWKNQNAGSSLLTSLGVQHVKWLSDEYDCGVRRCMKYKCFIPSPEIETVLTLKGIVVDYEVEKLVTDAKNEIEDQIIDLKLELAEFNNVLSGEVGIPNQFLTKCKSILRNSPSSRSEPKVDVKFTF